MLSIFLWLLFFTIGLAVGWFFPILDHKLSVYLMEKDRVRPVHRSFMFLAAVMVMSVLVMTTSRSASGFGALIGLQLAVLHVLRPIWRQPEQLRAAFFWDLAPEASYGSLRWLCVGFAVLAGLTIVRAVLLLLVG